MRISLKRYGSKIWKVSRCRPTVSNETILKTKQEFFVTKVVPVKSIADILLLGFQLMLFSRMFISFFTNIYFLVKFYSNVYISVNTKFECSYLFFWLKNSSFIKYVRNWGNESGSSKMFADAYRWRGLKIGYKIRTYGMDKPLKMLWNTFCALLKPSKLEHHCQQGKCRCFFPS